MGATSRLRSLQCRRRSFQSSPTPKDGCNCLHTEAEATTPAVSILTHPEGWVQQRLRSLTPQSRWRACFNPHPPRRMGATLAPAFWPIAPRKVSILTHPEGWVQPLDMGQTTKFSAFQSSPTPKDGCNLEISLGEVNLALVSILTHPEGWVQRSR